MDILTLWIFLVVGAFALFAWYADKHPAKKDKDHAVH